ncbi:hypothetical protein [Granulicella sp. dw_53]|uniref:hypothetical protein n=1 Tax=Granulicella sp. dw_53 TaxID=2719792 RepID=UPI001BD2559D|nr:hypothetical protein [Granulicella sp. dw_53]
MASSLFLTLLIGPIEALPAPKPLVDALTSVEVTESASDRSGFQLGFTLSNRSPLQTLFLLASGSPIPLLRLILMVTIGGIPQVIVDGIIEHHEVVPGASQGSSTLRVSGHDLCSVMDLIDLSGLPYPGMGPDVRVLTMLAKYAMFGLIPNVIPALAPDIPIPIDQIPIQQGTDLTYIKHLAREIGYTFYISPGPLPGMSRAYWGPQIKIGLPQPALNVNMDTWTNVESLNFRYQPQTPVLPIVFLQNKETKLVIPVPIPAANPLNPPLGVVVPPPQHVEFLHDTANRSIPQALMLGIAKAAETGDVVTGIGSLDVLRYGHILRSRELVAVRGAGIAYDGLHYVQSVTHTIHRGQYKQQFNLTRNALISNTPFVPALPI